MQSDFSIVANRVRQTVLIRGVKAGATGHRPLLPDEAERLLSDRVKGYVSDFYKLSDPEVGQFYASLSVDHTLLDQFQARILAAYAHPQLLSMSLE